MKRIVVLGATIAGYKAVKKIRETDKESSITLISYDGETPVKRDSFFGFIDTSLNRSLVDCVSESFYQDNKISLILDKKFLRINFNRGRVFLEGKEKETVEFDQLIITDVPQNKFPDIKGTNKTGVIGFRKIGDIEYLIEEIPYIETIVVQSDCFAGFQLATAIARRGKEVVMVLSGNGVISRMLASELGSQMIADCESNGLRFISDTFINEVLGDAEAKAVRLETGLVLSAQIVLFAQKELDFKMFNESEIAIEGKLVVDEQYKTSLDNVYACSDLILEKGPNLGNHPKDELCAVQGETIGALMSGAAYDKQLPLNNCKCEFAGYTFMLIGSVCGCGEPTTIEETHQEDKKYKCVFVRDNYCQGAFLVNNDQEVKDIERLIMDKIAIEEDLQEEMSSEAQQEDVSAPICESSVNEVVEEQGEDTQDLQEGAEIIELRREDNNETDIKY